MVTVCDVSWMVTMISKTDEQCDATLARLSNSHLQPVDSPLLCYARALDQMIDEVRSRSCDDIDCHDHRPNGTLRDVNNNQSSNSCVKILTNCPSPQTSDHQLNFDDQPNRSCADSCQWLQYRRSMLKTYAAHLRRTALDKNDPNSIGFVYNRQTNQTQLDETFGLNDRQFQLFQSQSFERIMRLRLHLQQAEQLQNEIGYLIQPYEWFDSSYQIRPVQPLRRY